MEVIETRISTASDEYKANYAQMERLVAELKAEMKKAREDRSEKALRRNAELGKLPVQKRLDLL
jgi:acetyl-CoA carboxylase carboxyltransferase component